MTKINALVQFTLIVFTLILSAVALAHPSNKWRLQFSGGSHSDGEIVLQFSPKGGEAFTVHVPVPADESENAVAKTVTRVLREKLPSDAFHVERDDGEDVLIKKKHGTANFDLIVVFNSVKHVRINPDPE
jgi:hypothetical protein